MQSKDLLQKIEELTELQVVSMVEYDCKSKVNNKGNAAILFKQLTDFMKEWGERNPLGLNEKGKKEWLGRIGEIEQEFHQARQRAVEAMKVSRKVAVSEISELPLRIVIKESNEGDVSVLVSTLSERESKISWRWEVLRKPYTEKSDCWLQERWLTRSILSADIMPAYSLWNSEGEKAVEFWCRAQGLKSIVKTSSDEKPAITISEKLLGCELKLYTQQAWKMHSSVGACFEVKRRKEVIEQVFCNKKGALECPNEKTPALMIKKEKESLTIYAKNGLLVQPAEGRWAVEYQNNDGQYCRIKKTDQVVQYQCLLKSNEGSDVYCVEFDSERKIGKVWNEASPSSITRMELKESGWVVHYDTPKNKITTVEYNEKREISWGTLSTWFSKLTENEKSKGVSILADQFIKEIYKIQKKACGKVWGGDALVRMNDVLDQRLRIERGQGRNLLHALGWGDSKLKELNFNLSFTGFPRIEKDLIEAQLDLICLRGGLQKEVAQKESPSMPLNRKQRL